MLTPMAQLLILMGFGKEFAQGHSQTAELCFAEISLAPTSPAEGFRVRVPDSHHCPLFNLNLSGYVTQSEKRILDLMKCVIAGMD